MKNKKKNEPGILDTISQVKEKEKKAVEEKERLAEKEEEKEREKYAAHLAEEKVELLKLRQGVIDESDKLDLSPDEKKHYNIWQKFKNFIYHNKWWLGITSFLVLIAAFLVYDTLTTVKSDLNVMLVSEDTDLYMHFKGMGAFFDSYVEDYNEDKKNYTNLLYIPISDDEDANVSGLTAYDSNLSKLTAEFQMGETMMLIGDSKSDDLILPEESLENLEKYFPDCPYVDGYKFYLKDTSFAEKIGYEENTIPDDLYIGIRKVGSTLSSEKDTKENHDRAIETLRKIINDIT